MDVIAEDLEYVTIRLDPAELVGIANSITTALRELDHRGEFHTLTGFTPEEATTLRDGLLPAIDRMRDARIKARLPW